MKKQKIVQLLETRITEINGRYTCPDCGCEFSAMMGDDQIPLICDCRLDYDSIIVDGDIVYNPLSNVIMIAGGEDQKQLDYENENYMKVIIPTDLLKD